MVVRCGQCMEMAATVTVNDLLDGHAVLDLECLDRIYLNTYVPKLQIRGQVAVFLTRTSRCADPVSGAVREAWHAFRPRCAISPSSIRFRWCASRRTIARST